MKSTCPVSSQHHHQKTTIACGANKTEDIPILLAYNFCSEFIYFCQILELSEHSLFVPSEQKLPVLRITALVPQAPLDHAFHLRILKKTMLPSDWREQKMGTVP